MVVIQNVESAGGGLREWDYSNFKIRNTTENKLCQTRLLQTRDLAWQLSW